MVGENLGIAGISTTQTGYTQKVGKLRLMTPEEKATFLEQIKKFKPNVAFEYITDKNGEIRMGKVVKYQKPSIIDIVQGKELMPLAQVKKSQVKKFLEKIQALGLEITEEDIITKNGTLNPNFKVDNKGNISFKNIKDYVNEKALKYFETDKGEWAEEALPAIAFKPTIKQPVLKPLPYRPGEDDAKVTPLPYFPALDKREIVLMSQQNDSLKTIA